MKIYEEKVASGRRFVLDMKLAGRRRRSYHRTRREAEGALTEAKRERKKSGDLFARYPEAVRLEWMMAHESAREAGFSLIDAVNHCKSHHVAQDESDMTVGKAIRAFLKEKRALIKPRSYRALSYSIERFGEDIWDMPLTSVSRALILDWITSQANRDGEPWGTRTRNGYLTDIKNLFNWCVAEEHLDASPANRIKRFRASDEEMEAKEKSKQILLPSEVAELMATIKEEHPDMVARAALLFFAGLRPDREAAVLTWNDIILDDDLIHVRGSTTKDRQSRYIPIPKNLKAWLQWAKAQDSKLPVTNWSKRWYEVKRKAGLVGDEWPHDASRHSFASYYLALHGADKTKAALGHGTFDMLFQHYRTLVRDKDAEKYFSIMP